MVRSGCTRAHSAPGQTPLAIIGPDIPVLGGGNVHLGSVSGVAPAPDGKFVWAADGSNSRVLRIRDPLTAPVVDVVLGQTDPSGTQCNRGLTGPAAPDVLPDMICWPGTVSLDRKGNLYVSDHSLEAIGNFRMLVFAPFPDNPESVIYAPSA